MAKFEKGTSGNPNGRPCGIVDRRRALGTLLENRAEDLVNVAIDMALGGDSAALRLCIERLIPKAEKERSTLQLGDDEYNKADAITQLGNMLLKAVMSGELAPCDGRTLGSMLDVQRKNIEASDLQARVHALEAALKIRGNHESK